MRTLTPRLLAPAIAVLALLAVAGCSSSGAGDSLSFMTFGEPEEIESYRTLIDTFEAAEPDIDVELIAASDRTDLLARLSTSFAGGTPPDLFLINYRFYAQFAVRGVLQPVGPRVDSSTAFRQGDFYPQALDAFRSDGVLTCLPQNLSSLVVYYNKDLLRQAGIAEPRAGWTWSQMVAAARTLTVDADGDGSRDRYGLGVEPSITRLAPFVWSNGGEVVDDQRAPTRLTLSTPAALGALREFLKLRTVYGVIPSAAELEAEDDESRFQNGKTAMLLQSRRTTPTFRTITAFDWDVAPLPRFLRQAGILHSDAYCITAASEQKDAAWRFIEYAVGPQGAPVIARTGRTVPSHKEVANSPVFLDPAADPSRSRVFLDTVPVIRALPSISTWPEIEDAAASILEEHMYASGASAEEVARELESATGPMFARGTS